MAYRLLWRVAEEFPDGPEHSVPWVIAPLADGGMQIEWRNDRGAIEVEIGPTGSLRYLVEQDGRTVQRSEGGETTSFDIAFGEIRSLILGEGRG